MILGCLLLPVVVVWIVALVLFRAKAPSKKHARFVREGVLCCSATVVLTAISAFCYYEADPAAAVWAGRLGELGRLGPIGVLCGWSAVALFVLFVSRHGGFLLGSLPALLFCGAQELPARLDELRSRWPSRTSLGLVAACFYLALGAALALAAAQQRATFRSAAATAATGSVKRGKIAALVLLLESGLDPSVADSIGDTALHVAAERGSLDAAQLLLDYGADVNARDSAARIPLHRAAASGHERLVELLLSMGANVNARDNSGFTPLALAARSGHKQVLELLKQHGTTQ